MQIYGNCDGFPENDMCIDWVGYDPCFITPNGFWAGPLFWITPMYLIRKAPLGGFRTSTTVFYLKDHPKE